MKKLPLFFLALATLLSSCSNQETNNVEPQNLLQSFKVVKNTEGKYSINYDVKDHVDSKVITNFSTKSKEIYLFDEKNANGKSFTEALFLEDNQLKVGFLENNEKRKSLIIEDANIVLAKRNGNSEFLASYSVQDLGNNTYKLDFEVKNNTSVSFVYNEKEDINEVHLKEGKENGLTFSKTYIKTSESLKIDFVNYLNVSARNSSSLRTRPRRPRVILID